MTLSRSGYGALLAGLLVALAAMLGLAVSFGSVRIPVGDVWAIVGARLAPGTFETWWTAARESIVIDSRLPRALTAAVVGASLALSGAVAQAVTRNPLADPYLLGVSSGAGFMVVLVSVLGIGVGVLGVFTIPVAAFVGAMIPLFLALVIGGRYPQPTAIILVGVALAQIFSALITFCILVLADDRHVTSVMHWIAGGFGDSRWSTLIFPTVALVVVGVALLLSARWMDVLQTGDDGAAALGMNVRRFRVLSLLAVSVLAGAAVSVAGGIGFIGLLIPHLAGFVVGTRAIRLLPAAALLGAVAMVAADTVARSVSESTELPVGVITALVGAPIFVWMLYRQYRRLEQ
ncbi:iron ABC transporter permease [Rhodococcus sp. AD45-ID]|uniref:Iron complex transport system permease protein n=2 Tax=Nocardiaceae TaxID=85025 RepID=A0A652YXE9_NOCGL|nr:MULTISPECIES: iron ABC transporter permease [Rhodococcus]NMD59287.1 iron ABC transporter permease [Nocardia globerula]NRI65776.1 iron ABC transporter permease [Rhodococcus sp. MS16]KJF20279.1 Iron(III) dicitrate transport system permease protein fecC [Rhodococcus sp. AD45]MDV6266982.1 iron ABC transporter permease [Rhodococcus globerulus]PSR41357.1 iron ABC transporter permease [Rhodococcus sp. AD45-ID]